MMFLAERWRHGRAGGLELGVRHGAWCLGCCWALGLGVTLVPGEVPGFAPPEGRTHDGAG